MTDDLPTQYRAYLDRFAREVGACEIGGFAKYRGKLIKKLDFDEFTPAFVGYSEMATQYEVSLERGDTVNDIVLRLLRDQAASLVLTPPA